MEQIHHHRGPQPRGFEQRGHIKTERLGRQIEPVLRIIEQPAMFTGLQPGVEPPGKIARLRAAGSRQKLAEVRQAAQARIIGVGSIDRAGNAGQFLGAVGSQQNGQPIAQECAVYGRVGQGERVEASWVSCGDPGVAAADRAHENLGTAILVEQDGSRRELLRLCSQEVHHHRLARTGRADDREIAQIAVMEIEEKRRAAGRLQQGYRIAPVVAIGLAQRETMEAAEAGHIGAGDQRAADQIGLVARHLPPEAGLKINVLANRDGAGVGQRGHAGSGGIVKRFEPVTANQDTQMMIAKRHRADAQRIAG